jgi:signal transduction histidine kinase
MQLLLLLGIAVLLAGLAALIYYLSLPFGGFEFVSQARIGSVMPGSPAEGRLRVGDQVLTVDGQPFRQGVPYLQPHRMTLELTVLRDGETLPVEMALVSPSLVERLPALSHFVVALAFWGAAIVVLGVKPKDTASQLFVLVCLLTALGAVAWLIADLGPVWANRLMSTIVLVLGPMFVHFHSVFPEESRFGGRKALLAALYGVSTVLFLISVRSYLFSLLRLPGPTEPLAWLTPVIEIHFALCAAIAIALLWRTSRRTASETCRRQISLVGLGTVLAVLPLIVFIAVPQILSAPYPIPTWMALLALVLIPVGYLYAIFRRDLMKVDWAVNRSVVIYLLAMVLAGAFIGISAAANRWLPAAFVSRLPDLLLAVPLLLVMMPVRQGLQKGVDRAFYGGWYDYGMLVSHISQELNSARDLDAVIAVLMNDLKISMRLRAVALLLNGRQDAFSVRGQRGFEHTTELAAGSRLGELLLKTAAPVVHSVVRDRFSSDPDVAEAVGLWSAAGAEMWVPLVQGEQLEGLLIVGGKLADDFYYPEDEKILRTVAEQAAGAIARVHLVDELQGRVDEVGALAGQVIEIEDQYQQRLSDDLHDMVLQDLLVAAKFLEGEKGEQPTGKMERSRRLILKSVRQLRSVMAELKPPDWGRVGFRQALQDHTATIAEERELNIVFQPLGDGKEIVVPKEIGVAVFRILQESLNNATRHADAEQIVVTLDLQPGQLRLEVSDDGVGFDPPAHFGTYVADRHLGLVAMRERARGIGGKLRVESQPGRGTRVVLEVPLPQA